MGLSKKKGPAASLQTLQMAEKQRMRDDTGRATGGTRGHQDLLEASR